MTKKNNKWTPSFEVGQRCNHREGTVHRCAATVAPGEEYCSIHKPATPIITKGGSRTNIQVVDNVTEVVVKKGESIKLSVKKLVKKFTNNRLVKFISNQARNAGHFLNGHKKAVAIGSTSVAVAGLFTPCVCSAIAVGAGVATLATMVDMIIAKKRKKAVDYRNLLVAICTAAAMPFLLLGAAYAGLYVTFFGAILPYSIIVA